MLLPGLSARQHDARGVNSRQGTTVLCMDTAERSRQEGMKLSVVSGARARAVDDDAVTSGVAAKARAGDPEAFRGVFQRYGRPVLAFIYHLLGDRARAEELTQETFFRAFRGFGGMQEGTKISTWLFGIARNVAREAMRNKRRHLREVGLDDTTFLSLQDERAGPDENFMTAELQHAIRRSLEGLSEGQRVVFVLKMLHKMRYQEISRITGSSIGKLKTDLHRARRHMRERLRPYLVREVPEMRGEL
jgi:RNA polymerase sigma-70 factor, ECF subfamily